MTALPILLTDPDWLVLLKRQRDSGLSVSEIARACGMARSTVSMLLSGTYPARSLDLVSRKHGARIVQAFAGGVACPHLRQTISREACDRFARLPMSTSNPDRLSHWIACSQCAHRPPDAAPG